MFTYEKTHLFAPSAVFFWKSIINSVLKFYFQFDVVLYELKDFAIISNYLSFCCLGLKIALTPDLIIPAPSAVFYATYTHINALIFTSYFQFDVI